MEPVLNQSLVITANSLNMTEAQFIKYSNDLTTVPALIILFVVTHLLFLIIGLSLVEKNRKKLVTIWILTFILSLGTLLALAYLPNITQQIVAFFN